MKFKQYLILTETESNIEHTLMKFINKKPIDPLMIQEQIEDYDADVLFKLSIVNPAINKLCLSPKLEDYWSDLWRQCGLNPRGKTQDLEKPLHEYLPMHTVPSSFTLLKGLYVYEAYRKMLRLEKKSIDVIKDAEEYLDFSAKEHCFFAMNALCVHGLKMLAHQFNEQLATRIIAYAQTAAQTYWSAGYLLLSNVYQELIQYKTEQVFQGTNLVINAFQALHVAKLLEKHSGPMINNAYQGKTLLEASGHKIKTFFQAQIQLQNLLGITTAQTLMAYKKAEMEVGQIKEKYCLQDSMELEKDYTGPTI